MKHLPNILTLANLFCGCIAIAFILHAPPYIAESGSEQFYTASIPMIWYGSIFIFIAGLMDVLDGAAARALGVQSPLGKDLDSLADIVSFGVAPSMILFKLLWGAWMKTEDAIEVHMLAMCPAFLVACFGALRLARFNNAPATTSYFTGTPIPSIGIFIASFPLIYTHNTLGAGAWLQNIGILYTLIALCCWLMVCKQQFFTIKLSSLSFQKNWVQYTWLALTLVSIFLLKWLAIPFGFLLYVVLSIVWKPSKDAS